MGSPHPSQFFVQHDKLTRENNSELAALVSDISVNAFNFKPFLWVDRGKLRQGHNWRTANGAVALELSSFAIDSVLHGVDMEA